jgi:hypothetical protein
LLAPSIPDDSARIPARPSNALLALLFLIAIPLFLWSQRGHLTDTWVEDLAVYTQAIHSWLGGHNPYNGSLAPLYFLYPPAFLLIAGWIAKFMPPAWGSVLYVVLNGATLCALPLILARYFFRQPWLSPLLALLLFFASPRFTGIEALRTANIATPLYCLAFAVAIPGLKYNRWRWFYFAVFLAAIVKITFLALLLLPLLAGRRQWLWSILCAATVAVANLGERLYWPSLYDGYLWSLRQGVLTSRAFGYGVFGLIADHRYFERGVGVSPYIVSGILALTLVGLMFWLRLRLERTGNKFQSLAANGIWLAMILTAIVLVNPRQMQYDIDISVFAAFVLFVYALRTKRLVVLIVVLFLPSLLVPFFISNPRFHGIYEVFLSYAAFALGYWRLTRETAIVSANPSGQVSLV